MSKSQEEFFRELLDDFKTEAAEHLQSINSGMLMLEKPLPPGTSQQVIETTFRELHSLKGAARAVNQHEIERLCQSMEDAFHKLKDKTISLTPALSDLLFNGLDMLGSMLSGKGQNNRTSQGGNLTQLLKAIENLVSSLIPVAQERKNDSSFVVVQPVRSEPVETAPNRVEPAVGDPGVPEQPGQKETVRVATAKLNNILREAEEFITAKATLAFFIEEIQRVNVPEIQLLQRDLGRFEHLFSRMVDDLLYAIKSTLLIPFSLLTDIVPRIVRDLGREFGKEIEVRISGAEVEIDRRILEELKDPLIHLIRNCIDHGIEKSDIRMKKGKPRNGSIDITISLESGRRVELVLADDGAGINRDRLKESALKNSVVTPQMLEQMNDHEVLALIFRSGVTTSPIITDLSGRGLGMSIVAAKVDGLGGSISIDSVPDKGTTFVISLPLTISTFRGVVVRVYNQHFVVPTSAVECALRIRQVDIKFAGSKPFLSRNNENIALVKLADALGLQDRPRKQNSETQLPVLIVAMTPRKVGFLVDEVLGEKEGTVKTLGPHLVHVRNVAGATVLGNGQVIPILHIPELIDSALRSNVSSTMYNQADDSEQTGAPAQNILVADDSITSRTLIRNILETAGYQVRIAVDGSDAFQILQSDHFDLVVSDVEMPNMNGFELTQKIRNDARFAATPVVLVTALSSENDRQQGMESGANAYIVKSNFEQSNLVGTIQRLI